MSSKDILHSVFSSSLTSNLSLPNFYGDKFEPVPATGYNFISGGEARKPVIAVFYDKDYDELASSIALGYEAEVKTVNLKSFVSAFEGHARKIIEEADYVVLVDEDFTYKGMSVAYIALTLDKPTVMIVASYYRGLDYLTKTLIGTRAFIYTAKPTADDVVQALKEASLSKYVGEFPSQLRGQLPSAKLVPPIKERKQVDERLKSKIKAQVTAYAEAYLDANYELAWRKVYKNLARKTGYDVYAEHGKYGHVGYSKLEIVFRDGRENDLKDVISGLIQDKSSSEQ